MNDSLTRRAALKGMLSTGTLALARQPASPLRILSHAETSAEMEVSVFSINPHTVRITVQPMREGSPAPLHADGAVLESLPTPPVARLRSLHG
ncbi:MAG: hypothetical protein WCC27_05350, partial [Acidobacteriaceae bacterium]